MEADAKKVDNTLNPQPETLKLLLIEADAEEAVRANERANLRAVGEAPAEDPPSQRANRNVDQIPGLLLRNS